MPREVVFDLPGAAPLKTGVAVHPADRPPGQVGIGPGDGVRQRRQQRQRPHRQQGEQSEKTALAAEERHARILSTGLGALAFAG